MDVIDNDADDTLEYSPKDTFIFNQEKSGKLTGEEIVTIPHPIIVVSYTRNGRKPYPPHLINYTPLHEIAP